MFKFNRNFVYSLLISFILVGIIYAMGLFNWGALPKAQDNAQTIDEAIGVAIVAHESDPTAHLGDGESLQQHKNNEIIDHPALSIVTDKFLPQLLDGLLFKEDGRGASAWIIQQTGANEAVTSYLNNITCHIEDNPPARADFAISFHGYKIDFANDNFYLMFNADFSNAGTLDSWFSWGWGILYGGDIGVGFRTKASDGHVYAFWRNYATYTEVDIYTPPQDENHNYKMTYESGNFLFYVDEVLKTTISPALPEWLMSSVLTVGLKAATGGSGDLYIRYIEYYQSSAML